MTSFLRLFLLSTFLSVNFCCQQPKQAESPNRVSIIGTDAGSMASSATCTRIVTWNIANLGKSKDNQEIEFMAELLRGFDLVCIQEVSTGPAGAQAVARLADALNRKGFAWDYKISDPTTGEGSERYAMLWKKSKVRLYGKAWLEQSLEASINREPMLARFISGSDTFLLATMHAVPKGKNPARENAQLYKLDSIYHQDHLLMMGDFNASHRSEAFDKMYSRKISNTISNQKTTLKMEPHPSTGEHLASEYDNIFYEKDEINLSECGIVDFSRKCKDLKSARLISDHIPVWGCYSLRSRN